jgi:3-dehydroquinate dehydratase/shikimate dehydrogenase
VIINATPVGMNNSKQSPLEEKELNTKFVFDLVYTPAETKLVKMARAKNLQVIPGLEMFVQQGARQFEIWTGKPSPIAEMAYVVSKALERQAAEEVGEEPEPTPKKTAAKTIVKKAATKIVKKATKAAKKR